MTSAQHPEAPPPAAEMRAADALYYRDVLHGLIEMGSEVARIVHYNIKKHSYEPGADSLPELTVAFDRVARAVRRTVILARKVSEPEVVAVQPEQRRAAARARIIRGVEDAIQQRGDGPETEALEAELAERMEGPELDEDIDGRPVDEIIADICRDLGIAALPNTRPWKRRTPAEVVTLCAAAGRVSAGLVVGAGAEPEVGWRGAVPQVRDS